MQRKQISLSGNAANRSRKASSAQDGTRLDPSMDGRSTPASRPAAHFKAGDVALTDEHIGPGSIVYVKPEPAPTCATCLHGWRFDQANPSTLACRRYPPSLKMDGISSGYVPVKPEWVCGEWTRS